MTAPLRKRLDALYAQWSYLLLIGVALLSTAVVAGAVFLWRGADLALLVLIAGGAAASLAVLWLERRKIWADFFGAKEDE
jgi:glucose-6-phosphate-specific signal transduction histidine kinase